jgi:hypothetical protein
MSEQLEVRKREALTSRLMYSFLRNFDKEEHVCEPACLLEHSRPSTEKCTMFLGCTMLKVESAITGRKRQCPGEFVAVQYGMANLEWN